jgi:predicted alpha/beta hydrolase family esterase
MQGTNGLTARPMSPYSGLPDDVRPVEGSTLGDLDRPRLLLLVHGFANDEDEAHAAFEAFQSALAATADFDPSTLGSVWEFHWPGNHPGNALIDLATFAARIPSAAYSGEKLAQYLEHLGQTHYLKARQQLFIVAHSLGCRAALQAIRIISKNPAYQGPTIQGVFLLAAAVPVAECLPAEFYQPPGSYQPLGGGAGEYVFCSRSDKALHPLVFGTGERQFGEQGPAVGRDGKPDHRWTARRRTGLQHGQYWSDAGVAEFIAACLRSWPVPLPEIGLPEEELGSVDITGPRYVSERHEPSRG